jgi:hypothetical protein
MRATVFDSTLTGPHCGHARQERMPADACLWFYECSACHAVVRPKRGDCCVFCSYGSVHRPPLQQAGHGRDRCSAA